MLLILVGTASKQIIVFDDRIGGKAATLENGSMVNTIYVFKTGRGLVSGHLDPPH